MTPNDSHARSLRVRFQDVHAGIAIVIGIQKRIDAAIGQRDWAAARDLTLDLAEPCWLSWFD